MRLFGPFVSVTVHSSPCLFKLIPQLPTFKTRACFDVVRGAVHSASRFTGISIPATFLCFPIILEYSLFIISIFSVPKPRPDFVVVVDFGLQKLGLVLILVYEVINLRQTFITAASSGP